MVTNTADEPKHLLNVLLLLYAGVVACLKQKQYPFAIHAPYCAIQATKSCPDLATYSAMKTYVPPSILYICQTKISVHQINFAFKQRKPK